MANLDPTVARVVDRAAGGSSLVGDDWDDEDAAIAALEAESEQDHSGLRERRLEQLHAEMARAGRMRDHQSTGTYHEVKDERTLMDVTTSCKLCLVHFFKSDFNRCRILDAHLEALAAKHYDTRFLRINVDNSPFLNTKLRIQVLPTLIAFVDGISVDRVIGFEGIGRGTDNFKTWQLEERLMPSNVLTRQKMSRGSEQIQSHLRTSLRPQATSSANDEEDDWD